MLPDLINRLLGRNRSRQPDTPARDLASLLGPVIAPAVHLVHSMAPSRSYLGGEPRLPENVGWPQKDGKPLDFIARISISDIRTAQPIEWLPSSGALLFFYSIERQPWGFDPRNRGEFAVLHVPDLPEALPCAIRPDPLASIQPRNVAARHIVTYPASLERFVESRNLQLTDEEYEALSELADREFRGEPKHQVAGYPAPVQGDHMELECQLVTNGLYCGNEKGYRDPRAKELEAGAANWRLLLQFDSDDELGVMWGDCGTLYFWVEEHRSRAGDFSNVWVIQQCG